MNKKKVPLIRCKNISLSFDGDMIFKDICLDIFGGDFIHLTGPNGAGKSSLLRIILGLQKPDSGEIFTPFKQSPPGYVPQSSVIDPLFPVTVLDIVSMGLYPLYHNFEREKQCKEKIRKMLEEFSLFQHADKPFNRLSGGMKQKTLLARALISDPDVLVLDEPASSLDSENEKELLGRLESLNKEKEKTVVMTHHHETIVFNKIPCKILRIENGHIF